MLKKTIIISTVILLAAGSFFGARWYVDNKYPAFEGNCDLFIYPDTTVRQIEERIDTCCTLKFPGSIDRVFKKEDVASNMKPGHYVIEKGKPAVYVARMINHGWQTPVSMTLSGTIRSKERLARIISKQMMVDSLTVDKSLRDDDFLSGYGFSSKNVFSLILPDTYQLYWTADINEIFDRFRKEYDEFWNEERLKKASKIGLTPGQVSVLASIVAGETRAEKEFSRIAGVYMNRLNKGMKLQADPTICYIYDYKINRVLKKHLEADSPFNTYKYAGLPPAPINVPGKKYIDSVLDYERHNYIFFCANPAFDGTHNFAVDYSAHLQNARAYSKALTVYLKNKNK